MCGFVSTWSERNISSLKSPQNWECRAQPLWWSGVHIRCGGQENNTVYRRKLTHRPVMFQPHYVWSVRAGDMISFLPILTVWGKNLFRYVSLQLGERNNGKWNPRTCVCDGQYWDRPVSVSNWSQFSVKQGWLLLTAKSVHSEIKLTSTGQRQDLYTVSDWRPVKALRTFHLHESSDSSLQHDEGNISSLTYKEL